MNTQIIKNILIHLILSVLTAWIIIYFANEAAMHVINEILAY